jgi:hypothetical protein
MAMKIHHVFWLTAALPVMQLAQADVPFTNRSLGMMEGTLAFCAESDPATAPKYQERALAMVRGLPEKELAQARESGEYKDVYSSIGTALAGASKEEAKKTCADLLSRHDGFVKGSP